MIAITNPLGNDIQEILLIEPEKSRHKQMNIVGTSPVLVDIGNLTPGKTTLKLNSSTKQLVLNCSWHQNNIKLPTPVTLKFQNDLTANAYSLKIRECLQSHQLTKISFPLPMRFDIHTQQSNLPFDIKADETLEYFQKRALQDINKINY